MFIALLIWLGHIARVFVPLSEVRPLNYMFKVTKFQNT